MKVLVTGTAEGIGHAIALKFLNCGHQVIGFDICPSTITDARYTHYIMDITNKNLPEINDFEIIINNAGVQKQNMEDIQVNLIGTMNVTEKYAFQEHIKSIVNIASASATTGAEFPEYAAAKGGILAYTKNVALRVARYNATCNSLSPGGVITDLNKHILEDETLWNQVLDEALLHKWSTVEEIAEWTYFVAVINKSMTAQDILIDNGEAAKSNFIW